MAKKYEEMNDVMKSDVNLFVNGVKRALRTEGVCGLIAALGLMCNFVLRRGDKECAFEAQAFGTILEGMGRLNRIRKVDGEVEELPDSRETEYLFWVAWQINGLVNAVDGGDKVVSAFPWERVQWN